MRRHHCHGIIIDRSSNGIIIDRSSNGIMKGITFDATGFITVNGQTRFVANQDGFGIRQGCHDIIIEDCTGRTGDDYINIGAYFNNDVNHSTGNQNTISPSGDNYRGAVDDTHNIICRNWYNIDAGQWKLIKIMGSGQQKQYNIIISDMVANIDSRISLSQYKIAAGLNTNFIFKNLMGKIRFVADGGYIKNSVFRDIQYIGSETILGGINQTNDGHVIDNVRKVTI